MIYKISGSWGNHEGSMLLLLTILSLYYFFFSLGKKTPYSNHCIHIQGIVIALFALYTAFASNPFELVFIASNEGLGLNPLLQDIGLALHPPMLYLGYIGFVVVFSLALSGLINEKVNSDLAKQIRPWLLFSWSTLTLGIGLGSWWAYRELGWGGYWFWDPVENVSLMPWLGATALIHANKALEKKNSMKVFTILMAISTFILSLLGIFLVRSGLLTSVHSFAIDSLRGYFIILLITLIGGAAFLIFALKASKIIKKKNNFNGFFDKLIMILLNNYFIVIALFAMLLGVFYPIFAREFFDQTVSIGASYYNKIFAILLTPFLLIFCAYYINLTVKKSKNENFLDFFAFYILEDLVYKTMPILKVYRKLMIAKFIIFIAISALISGFFFHNSQNATLLELSILFLAIFASLMAIAGKKSPSNIAHLGFSLVLMGIILSSYLGISKEINIKEQETVTINERKIKFEKTDYEIGKNFVARTGFFTIDDKIELKPQLRYYPVSQQTTFEASIHYGIFGDLYLALGNKDENENYALRIYCKPFIYLIWLGIFMIFCGGLFGCFKSFRKLNRS
jgi:cytochrome c-type biogenesis protein CcmF